MHAPVLLRDRLSNATDELQPGAFPRVATCYFPTSYLSELTVPAKGDPEYNFFRILPIRVCVDELNCESAIRFKLSDAPRFYRSEEEALTDYSEGGPQDDD